MLLNFNTVFRIIHICAGQRDIGAFLPQQWQSKRRGPLRPGHPLHGPGMKRMALPTLTPQASSSGQNRHQTSPGHSPRRHKEGRPHQRLPPKAAHVPSAGQGPNRQGHRTAQLWLPRSPDTELSPPGPPGPEIQTGLPPTHWAPPWLTILSTRNAADTDGNKGSSLKGKGPRGRQQAEDRGAGKDAPSVFWKPPKALLPRMREGSKKSWSQVLGIREREWSSHHVFLGLLPHPSVRVDNEIS